MKHLVLVIGMLMTAAHINASEPEQAFSFNGIDVNAFPYIWKRTIDYGDIYHPRTYPGNATPQQILAVLNHPLCKCVERIFQKNGTYDIEKLNQLDAVCENLTIKPGYLDFSSEPTGTAERIDRHYKAMAIRNCVGVLKFNYYTRNDEQLIVQVDKMLSNH